MKNNKVNYSLRMTPEINQYVNSEAKRLGLSKSAFLHFLITMYRTEQEQTGHIKMTNEQMYKVVREEFEKELRS